MMKRLKLFCSRHAATLYWLLALVLISTELYFFYREIADGILRRIWLVTAVADTLVLLVPFWWLPGKWRGLVLVPAWIMTIFYIGNLLNFRFWGRLIPFMLITQAGNANGVLVDSAIGVLRPADVFYVVVPVVLTALWCIRSVRRSICAQAFGFDFRMDMTLLVFVMFFVGQYMNTKVKMFGMDRGNFTESLNAKFKKLGTYDAYIATDTRSYFSVFGQNIYLLHQISTLLSDGRIDLTPEQSRSLEEYCRTADPQETALTANRGKNVVLIIVESLNASIVNRRLNGREITPVLNSLAAAPGSVSCLKVRPQIGEGNSADGQLMYNVGLLPTSVYVGSADYVPALDRLPSLSRHLPDSVDRAAIFADHGNGWNKMEAYRKYGYEKIFNDDSIRAHTPKGMSRDGAMFSYALEKIDSMARPFHLQLLTIQMHAPYNERVAGFTNYAGLGLGVPERRYINCTADFDRHLGSFILGLKDRGLWENTLLIIASDHNSPGSMRADGEEADIVFIATNTGVTESIDSDVSQIDVFPTMVDIMGSPADAWRGVGRSMLGSRRSKSDARQAGVSDSLLRSDYFR